MTTALKTKVNQQDLKIYPSERLTQTDDGGGMPLGMPLTGELNELFQPISSIARVNGAFYAVLEYMGVLRADDEPLIGAFAAITKPPSDPTVSYLMFPATRFGESRAEILKRIEAYNVGTIESRMTLLSTQPQNSKLIQAYQRVGEPLPMVGDVYCLRQDKAGYANDEQYIQVTRVKAEDRIFTNTQGKDFTRTVVQMEISSKLEADFIGANYPSETYIDNPCKIRETAVADAAQYYGVSPLAAPINKEVMQIKVASLMEKIVPTNQITVPLVDLTAAGQRQTMFDGSRTGTDGLITLAISKSHSAGSISNIYFGNAVLPGSIDLSTSVGEVIDKGGTLYRLDLAIGSIDYANGFALINEPTFAATLNSVKFRPASVELKVANTARINVDINNRSSSYTETLNPPPAVGTLQVSYRSQGEWYTISDNGSGTLVGASAQHGSGNVNFVTGSVVINMTELPDVGSAILFSWGTKANYFNRSGGTATAKMVLQLANDADPSSIRLAWNDGAAKTATSNAAGVISGNWIGQYDANTRQILIDTGANFNHPAGVLDVIVTYAQGEKTTVEVVSPLPSQDGTVTIDISDTPLQPNSVNLSWRVSKPMYANKLLVTAKDDGNGNIVDKDGKTIGTVNYSSAVVTYNPNVAILVPTPTYSWSMFGGLVSTGMTYVAETASLDGGITASFYTTAPSSQVTENLNSGIIVVDLLPTYDEVVTPASVNFKWGDKTYFDKQGSLYTDLNPQTGAATLAGSIDYQNGKATLTNWIWKSTATIPVVASLVTTVNGNAVSQVTFRTPSSPIRPGGLQVRATATDGTLISARADYNGKIIAANISGLVDAEYGVADIKFGKMVALTDQVKQLYWYDSTADKDGQTWQPVLVFPETITYNADAYTYLPIDSNVVKIDTVRLPQDGRVPIFRRGDSILIRNAQTDNLGSAFTGGQTINLSRNDVDRISLLDADNKPVLGELWDYDLDAGSITFKTSIDLSSYKMPLKAIHAQEQRNRIVDLDIDGSLSLLFAANRNYPIENTYVSSLLIGDDLAVRVSVPFTQRSWNNVWQDTPVGDPLLNKLKLTD